MDRTGERLGVTRQREDCYSLAERRGWTISPEHDIEDNDTSATSAKPRPGFTKLLKLINERQVDVVVCWAADRLVRRMVDLEHVIEQAEAAGVKLATVSGELDLQSDQGRLLARILTSVARGEIERKSARQVRAYEQAAAAGRPPGGVVPFGFRRERNPDSGVLELRHHPEQAPALAAAYDELLRGATLASIARTLNALGLTSGKRRTSVLGVGEPASWSAETVKVMLKKGRNAAVRERKGQIIGPADWEPIVSEATWRAALAVLNDPGRARSVQAPPNAQHLLSGVAVCAVCRAPVNAGTTRPTYFSYRCRTLGHVARRGDKIDEHVSKVFLSRISRPDASQLLAKPKTDHTVALQASRDAAAQRLRALTRHLGGGVFDEAQLIEDAAEARAEIESLDLQLNDAAKVQAAGEFINADEPARHWAACGETADGRARQRRAIAELLEVVLHPVGRGARLFDESTVELRWKSATEGDR